ncbi:UBX domain-containing protein 10 [Menidia menidia]
MHLAKPNWSKGRSKPDVTSSLHTSEPDNGQRTPVSRVNCGPEGLTKEGILYMLQHPPAGPRQPFNKYKVLPSIERRQPEDIQGNGLNTVMTKLDLSGDPVTRPCGPEGENSREISPASSKAAGSCGGLLLAVRAPCGQRFQQLFEASDTLLEVIASAEARYGARYEGAFVETVDIPRATFRDLNMSLVQCGILNRSVLCITENKDPTGDYK